MSSSVGVRSCLVDAVDVVTNEALLGRPGLICPYALAGIPMSSVPYSTGDPLLVFPFSSSLGPKTFIRLALALVCLLD
jgi:hypothetical protein